MNYIKPTAQTLNLQQFIQTVLVGISGLPGNLVRPKWQPNPPKQPDAATNWLAFGLTNEGADTNASVQTDKDGVTELKRNEHLEIQCCFYGPNCLENAGILRDGFEIQQNLSSLKAANMGFIEAGKQIRTAELVNEQWIDRIDMTINLVRQINRIYPILTFLSLSGTIRTDLTDGENTIDWLVK